MSSFDQKKTLNKFVACIWANSFLDIDGLYFLNSDNWYATRKQTGLMAATSLGFNDLARTLIHYNANINARVKRGVTTLIFAAANCNNEMVRILLRHGANVNGADNVGRTPLHAAAFEGHLSTVRLLLERGADINAIESTYDIPQTALETASTWGHTDVVALLKSFEPW